MSQPQVVLYIDDSAEGAQTFCERLPSRIRILRASTVSDGLHQFRHEPGITMIVIAGDHDTTALEAMIMVIRPRFKGPMIAGCNDANVNRALMDVGCNDMVIGRPELSTLVKRMLLTPHEPSAHRHSA